MGDFLGMLLTDLPQLRRRFRLLLAVASNKVAVVITQFLERALDLALGLKSLAATIVDIHLIVKCLKTPARVSFCCLPARIQAVQTLSL